MKQIKQMKTNKAKLNKVNVLVLAVCMGLMQTSYALDAMTDDELSKSTAQGEFLTLKNIGTTQHGNPNPNVGFTRLTLNAKLELNSNMDKLRLGCDNANYTNCDISIDKLVLSGIVPAKRANNVAVNYPIYGTLASKLGYIRNVAGTLNGSACNGGNGPCSSQFIIPENKAPGTDFVMDNPFIELAIQNPDSLVNRKMVGFRFGAHEVWGMMGTGEGPRKADRTAESPDIIGPANCNGNNCATFNPNIPTQNFGKGQAALDALYNVINQSIPCFVIIGKCVAGNLENARVQRFNQVTKKWLSYSIGKGHTGVNQISGRMPVRLENFDLEIRVRDTGIPLGFNDTTVRTAIASGSLARNNANNSDFGRIRNGGSDATGNFDAGYLRNVFLGDTDTIYDPVSYGNYVANSNSFRLADVANQKAVGRAPTFKRASAAALKGMMVHIHTTGIAQGIAGGDRFNNQTLNTQLFHNLQFGTGTSYEPGRGSKHMAFQYQTLDGLQWITTDKRLASAYDVNGNPTAGSSARGPYDGYDWLSTRAGWWLESPMATVRDAFVPMGQILNKGQPAANDAIVLGNIDLGSRPADNCYGNLSFC